MRICPNCNTELEAEIFNDYEALWCKVCHSYICPKCNIDMDVDDESERWICGNCGYMGEDVEEL